MRIQVTLPLVLARALSARVEGRERTLPFRQVYGITAIPGIR
jgi:hypothetical protein